MKFLFFLGFDPKLPSCFQSQRSLGWILFHVTQLKTDFHSVRKQLEEFFFLQELRMLIHVEKEKEKENILPVTKLKFQDHLCMSPMLGFHHMQLCIVYFNGYANLCYMSN